MSFLEDLINQAKGLLDTPPKPDKMRSIKTNWFDDAEYERLREETPAIQKEEAEFTEFVDHADQFVPDLFSTFFKVQPEIEDDREIAPTYEVNHAVIKELQDMKEVQNLRQWTVTGTYETAMAMLSVQEEAGAAILRIKEQVEEQQQQRQAADDAEEEARQGLMGCLEGMPTDGTGDPGELQAKMDQFNKARQDAQQANANAQQAIDDAVNGAKEQMRNAAKQTDQQLQNEADLAAAFGTEPGVLQRMSVEERMALAATLRDNRLAQFVKLLGQFKAVQQAKSRERVVNASSEIHGITYSGDLTRMIAAEQLNFAHPVLESLMLSRFASNQLLTHDVRGKEKLGQGPIVCIVDESGSMGAADVAGGTREAWSKALVLAMLDQAKRRKRDFVYIGFSSVGQQHIIEFLHGETTLDKVIQMTEHFYGGGTNYEQPLTMALKYIEDRYDKDDQNGRPDIVFLSDDSYRPLDPQFMAEWHRVKEKLRLTCYAIAIGCASTGAMQQFADNVREITELVSDPRVVGDLFQTI